MRKELLTETINLHFFYFVSYCVMNYVLCLCKISCYLANVNRSLVSCRNLMVFVWITVSSCHVNNGQNHRSGLPLSICAIISTFYIIKTFY